MSIDELPVQWTDRQNRLPQTSSMLIGSRLPSFHARCPKSSRVHAAGEGTKGIRLYDWARIALPWIADTGLERWVLIRRSRHDPEAYAYYLVFAPAGSELAELAGVAGRRWTIEECFQRAKEELGLDHCEARSWHGWHRHMTLCMAAAAFLARFAAQLRQGAGSKANERSPVALAA
jgi:hypothetical protein